ncbi:MAG: 7TM diverse intracellular signaling domain-containing protein [Janthinobacterium lividum]
MKLPLALEPGSQYVFLDTTHFQVLADATGQLTLPQVQQSALAARFGHQAAQPYTMRQPGTVYWMRLSLRNDDPTRQRWFLELFDSHITHVTWYYPTDTGRYDSVVTGASQPYATRPYQYRDFIFPLEPPQGRAQTYYIKLRSDTKTSLHGIVWSDQSLVAHLHEDSSWLGIFYGVLGIMVLYNLCLYLFVGEKTYLYYVLYVLSCGLLFLTEDGLGFEHVWPTLPGLNHLLTSLAPMLLLIQFALYSRNFLDTAQRLPQYDRWLKLIAIVSALAILLDVVVLKTGQSYWLYLLPYGSFYAAAAVLFRQGFKPARFYLAANLVVAISVVFLITRKLGIELLNDVPAVVYSMNIAFVLEAVVLSYALGEKIRGIKTDQLHTQQQLVKQLRKKHQAQEQLVEQLHQNQELKDNLNTELEKQVLRRTQELQQQAQTIALRNRELTEANGLLNLQAATIEKLNQELQRDLQQTQEARVLSKSVNFGEFSRIYPDRDASLHYLAELKWQGGFRCRKCGHEKSCDAREPHAQRCTRCGYVESATAYTILHRCKFDIVKALYAVFVVHVHQGQYSALELSQVLDLRQATCWNFIQKVQVAMQIRQQAPDYDKAESWTRILLDDTMPTETVEDEGTGKELVSPQPAR